MSSSSEKQYTEEAWSESENLEGSGTHLIRSRYPCLCKVERWRDIVSRRLVVGSGKIDSVRKLRVQ